MTDGLSYANVDFYRHGKIPTLKISLIQIFRAHLWQKSMSFTPPNRSLCLMPCYSSRKCCHGSGKSIILASSVGLINHVNSSAKSLTKSLNPSRSRQYRRKRFTPVRVIR